MARRLCHLLVCTPLLLPNLEGGPLRLPATDSWVGPEVPGYGIVFVWHGISPKGLSQRHNLSTNWGQRDVQLYLDTFTGVPKAILCQACNCSDHITDSRPFSPSSADSSGPKREAASTSTKGSLCPHPLPLHTPMQQAWMHCSPPRKGPTWLIKLWIPAKD